MTDAPAGWITIGTATIWAGKGVSALIASRRAAATPRRRERAQKWQWLALAALQVILGVWFLTDPSAHPAVLWWLTAGFGALLAWMFITDVGPWLRSRLRRSSSHAPF
jgi:hypothetical protein